jgi:hypothetical protein
VGELVSPERGEELIRWFRELRPRTLQANVRCDGEYANGATYTVRLDDVRLRAILATESIDGQIWAHLSVSAQAPARIPTWQEFRWHKDFFLGDRKAIQVLPPRAEYVNLQPHVLHLFVSLEGDPLPDFRRFHPKLGPTL